MRSLDILTVVIFVIGILSAGLAFSNKGKDLKSFFAAGGAIPWQISGLSLFMGFFSAGTFVVWGSIAYLLGWVAITIQWTMAFAGFAVGLLIARRWHNTGILTVAEYITGRFGLKTQKTYTFLFLFISVFTTGSFLYPVAKIVEVATGLDLHWSILLLGAICILYVTAGGLWAVVVTDVLQFVILLSAVIIVIPLSFDRAGGVSGFIQSAPDTFFNLLNGEYTLGFIIAFGIYNAIFLGGNWAYVQRYTSVKTAKDAGKTGYLFGSLYLISPVLWMLPPMIYRVVNPSLSGLESEGAYLMICKEVLPAGMLGMMLGGMIFATASSLNSALNISSGVFTNDIFKRLSPGASNRTLIRAARFSTLGFGLIAIGIALLVPFMGGIVNVVISVAALTGVPLYLPVIWSLFSKWQTRGSILSATLLSLAINATLKFIAPALIGFSLDRTLEMIVGVSLPTLILLFFECYYRVRGKAPSEYFTGKKQEEIKKDSSSLSDNKFSIRVIGAGITLIGLVIVVLGCLSDRGQRVVVIMGAILILAGIRLFMKGRAGK